jgi:predicted ATPase
MTGKGTITNIGFIKEGVNADSYPFALPFKHTDNLRIHPHVNFFVGDNGSGKSTLLEAIAVASGFNPEGGSRNFNFNRVAFGVT